MNTITVSVPASVAVQLKGQNSPMELDLGGKTPEWFGWVIAFGARQSANDGDAGKNGTDKGYAAILDKFTRIAAGEIPAGGGSGKSLSWETKATRKIIESALRERKFKAAEAREAAESDSAWEFLAEIRLAEKGNESPDADAIAAEVAAMQEMMADDIAEQAAEMERIDKENKERDARAKAAAKKRKL